MDAILELFKQDFAALIIGMFLVMAGIIAIADIIGKFSVLIGKPVKWIRSKEKDHDLLLRTVEELNQFAENRKHDREQSFQIQKELTDAQKELAKSISMISKKIDEMQRNTDERFARSEQKNNKRIRAELKDKISQSYRYHHALGKISPMELEALEDLIEEYEAADGKNSFVHSVVQKEMYKWLSYIDTQVDKI